MINLFRKHWLVVIQEVDQSAVVPNKDIFIVRDRNAWKAYDAIKGFLRKKKGDTGNKWELVNMTRV